ncbi:hypothetical protein [Luteibacter sp.]|uniref:hypothetical protein n=1 Tax=Luteibacter sp. TaxID=1886636 RepID=UPI003F7ED589
MAEQKSNGRRAVIVVVGIAFLASVTTLILALTASHGARQRDAAAITADGADLHGVVSEWRAQVVRTEAAQPPAREAMLDSLRKQAETVAAWKPRTPCGLEARDRLRAAMDTRITSLLRNTPGTVTDELSIVDDALRTCSAQAGRDVEG